MRYDLKGGGGNLIKYPGGSDIKVVVLAKLI